MLKKLRLRTRQNPVQLSIDCPTFLRCTEGSEAHF